MTAVFRLCDDYVTRSAALDPVSAGMRGLSTEFGAATDFGPDGNAAREELVASTLAALAAARARSAGGRPGRDRLAPAYGDGPLAGELADAAAQANRGYREIARYLREDYAPRAAERDGAGAERYALAARLSLGADIDLAEAYAWGWAELGRIEGELAAEAARVS